MKFAALLASLGVAFVFSLAHAGDTKRNGGILLSCSSGIRVLDLYEAEFTYGYQLALPQGETPNEVLEQIFSRIERHNPRRANLYRNFLTTFEKESRWIAESDFTTIPDIGAGVPVPKNCETVQAVSQLRKATPQGVRYLISSELWGRLNSTQKAALMLHEFIYREVTTDDQSIDDSRGVRFFTGYLFSQDVLTNTLKDYILAIKSSDLSTAEYLGYPFRVRGNGRTYDVEFTDLNTIKTVSVGDTFSIPTSEVLKNISCVGVDPSHEIRIIFEEEKTSIVGNCKIYLKLKGGYNGQGYALVKSIDMSPEGKIQKAHIYRAPSGFEDTLTVHYFGDNFEFFGASSNYTYLYFDSKEDLQKLSLRITSREGLAYTTYKKNGTAADFRMITNYEIWFTRDEQDKTALNH